MPSATPLLLFLAASVFCITAHSASPPDKNELNLRGDPRRVVLQQDFEQAPPLPFLDIGLQHIASELIANGTEIDTDTKFGEGNSTLSSSQMSMLENLPATQCGPDRPCLDASCCNSNGQCGYEAHHCGAVASSTCISNCNAKAMCGRYAPVGEQKCPLDLCCSFTGYCGPSELHCLNLDPNGKTKPCQEGFGNCRVVPAPSCGNAVSASPTASKGRKIAYYQGANLLYRKCHQIPPAKIHTTGLTHLIFAFAAIDPNTFEVTPANKDDPSVYAEFTALKTGKMQTWISLGGFTFSDPGPTFTTWSDLCSKKENRVKFISSLIKFMDKYGFDGCDIDWEFPGLSDRGGKAADKQNLILLVREMRGLFGDKYGISMALPNDYYYLERFDPVAMEPSLDFINFMTYDMHGPWEESFRGAIIRPQTSIVDIEKVTIPIWFSGLSPPKINLGMAFYGRGYTIRDKNCVSLGCPYKGPSLPGRCTSSPGVLSLTEIKELIKAKKLVPELIKQDMIKQLTFDDQWIGYDDEETIALKTRWADQHCLGGTAVWSIDFNSGPGNDAPRPPAAPKLPTPEEPEDFAALLITKDGTCGGKQTCNGSRFGSCCSQAGFCGSLEAYCGQGCQTIFGQCADIVTSLSNPAMTLSVDGTCGPARQVTCEGSAFGGCCSRYNYCGNSKEHCDVNNWCQSQFGNCQ